jgi:hypothetical protein
MGVSADAINKVKEVLEAEKTGGTLTYLAELFFGSLGVVSSLAKPFILVRLPRVPYSEESWAATGNKRDARLLIEIVCVAEEKEAAFPYGKSSDAANRGILTLVDDVMNALDNNRGTILSANGKLLDFTLSIADHDKIAEDAKDWQASVLMELKVRFTHGTR